MVRRAVLLMLVVMILLRAADIVWAAPPSPYGYNTPSGSPFWAKKFDESDLPKMVQLLSRAGVKWVRIRAVWFMIEPKQDQWNEDVLRRMEALLSLFHEEEISVSLVLGKTPGWTSKAPPGTAPKMYPGELNQWRQYVREMADRFAGGMVQAWEVENEVSGKEGFRRHRRLYVKMCRAASRIIKARDPDAVILLSSIVPAKKHGKVITYWLRKTRDCVDVLNVHKYGSDEQVLESISRFRKFAERAGAGRKPIWMTETNICGSHKSWCHDPSDGGKRLRSRYRTVLASGVKKVFWFPLASGGWGPGILEKPDETGSGEFERHQPMYRAYKRMATQ